MNLIFAICFSLCLALPLLTMDTEKNKVSEIDNEYLPELKQFEDLGVQQTVETYLNKRIGFRVEALDIYQKINYHLFGLIEHPTYMNGQEEHVFFKSSACVKNYQHLNLNSAKAQEFAQTMRSFQDYVESCEKDFLYFLIPDKETVYPEFYPHTVNVYGDLSRSDELLGMMEDAGVHYLFAKDAMLEAKKTCLVNNVQYDAGHWNDHGAFYSLRGLYEYLQKNHPEIELLEQDEFMMESEYKTSLQVSHFEIEDEVPVYSLKNPTATNETKSFTQSIYLPFPDQRVLHYSNAGCADKPKLLIFGDSYLADNAFFFTEHFSEYTFIHRNNVLNQEFFEYYVDQVNPDIVIFENPERTLYYDLNQNVSLEQATVQQAG